MGDSLNCQSCGKSVRLGMKFCPYCGRPSVQEEIAGPVGKVAPPPPPMPTPNQASVPGPPPSQPASQSPSQPPSQPMPPRPPLVIQAPTPAPGPPPPPAQQPTPEFGQGSIPASPAPGSTFNQAPPPGPPPAAPTVYQAPAPSSTPPTPAPQFAQPPHYQGQIPPPHMAQVTPAQPARKRSVLKILLIVGAVGIVLIIVAAVGVFFVVRHFLGSSGANEAAVAALRGSQIATQVLGEIQDVGTPLGSISSDAGGSGNASLSMSVKGARASGQYFATVERVNGIWVVMSARLQLSDGRSIELDIPAPQTGGIPLGRPSPASLRGPPFWRRTPHGPRLRAVKDLLLPGAKPL